MRTSKPVWIGIFILGLLFFCTHLAVAAKTPILLSQVKASGASSIILELNGNPSYKVITLDKPPRVAIDLPDVKLTAALDKIPLKNSAILHVRSGHPTPGTLRIVLDLATPLYPQTAVENSNGKTKLLIELNKNPPPDSDSPAPAKTENLQQTQQWLQEDLTKKEEDPGSKQALTTKQELKPPAQEKNEEAVASEDADSQFENSEQSQEVSPTIILPTRGNRPIIVVIDPGHGGKDPGTSGSLGVKEKDVVLGISLNLQRILSRQPGFKAVLTRDRDYFIPLRGRLAIARQQRGDMFIAIHADAFKDPYAAGASVFALSAHGASSEAARWLAEKENYSELGGVNLSDKSNMLRSVLIDLSQTATISSSLQLGTYLLNQLGQIGRLHHGFVEQAPFMVLKSPDIPSVLVETGFLSNPSEQERLRNPVSQAEIANALSRGVINYFKKNPPPGTYFYSLQSQKNKH